MMNNITQVSPGNRVDFSRIRKAQQGLKIPKFLNAGKIYNFDAFLNNLPTNQFKRGQTSSSIPWTPNWEGISGKYANVGELEADDQYKAFTDYVINNYLSDPRVMDYLRLLEQTTINPNHKSILFDVNGNLNQNWADEYRRLRNDGKYGYYHLGPEGEIQQPPTEEPPVITPKGEPPVKQTPPVETTPWEPVKYTPQEKPLRKFDFPTFPLYNAALLGIADITNKRILNTQLKAPSMRYQSPTLYGKITDAYSERAANNQALQEYNWGVQQQLDNTSDLGRAQDAQRDLLSQLLNVKLQNNKAKQDEYNQTSENLQNINNLNLLNWTNTANQNRQAHVVETRDRLNAIAQYQAQRGQNLQENIMSNYTDWKSWNRNKQLQDYADWRTNEYAKVQKDLDKAYEDWQNSGDISKYQGYKDFWKNLMNSQGNPIPGTKFGDAYAKYLNTPGVKDSEETRLKFFNDNYANEDYKNDLGSLLEGWNKYQADAMNRYAKDYKTIQNRWGLIDSRNKPYGFTGETSSWLYNLMNPKASYNSIYSMKKGGRFLEYLEHNRKAEKDIRDATMKTMQDSRRLLARDLDALDRESLLLLRAIFK